MTYGGAAGQTAEKMAEVLHFSGEPLAVHSAFSQVAHTLGLNKSEEDQIYIANRLWGQKNYGFLASFLQLTEEYYGATLAEVDFQTQPEESARDTINQWVAAQTQENITDLIPAGVSNPSTRLVLTNAIFSKKLVISFCSKKHSRKIIYYRIMSRDYGANDVSKIDFGMENTIKIFQLFFRDYLE